MLIWSLDGSSELVRGTLCIPVASRVTNATPRRVKEVVMQKLAIGLVGGTIVIALLALAVPRDPIDRFPGTRLTGDVVAEVQPDWSFSTATTSSSWK